MTHYVAIVEDSGPEKAVGAWLPDLPGCLSGADTIDEVLRNAAEGVAIHADALAKDGRPLPAPRSIAAIRSDPAVARDIRDHMIALVSPCVDSAHAE